MEKYFARCGVQTQALIHVPELESGALDHWANLATCELLLIFRNKPIL